MGDCFCVLNYGCDLVGVDTVGCSDFRDVLVCLWSFGFIVFCCI